MSHQNAAYILLASDGRWVGWGDHHIHEHIVRDDQDEDLSVATYNPTAMAHSCRVRVNTTCEHGFRLLPRWLAENDRRKRMDDGGPDPRP